MIILYILLVIVFIIAFILFTNISAYVRMINDDIYLKVGAYGIYIWILNPNKVKPSKKKTVKHKNKKSTEKTKKVENSKEKKEQEINKSKNSFLDALKNKDGKLDIKKVVSLFSDISKSIFPMLKNLVVKIKVKDLKIQISIGAEDAHSTAIQYANIGNSIEILAGYLQTLNFVKIKKMQVYPDFVTGEIRYDISFFIKIRIGTVVKEALKALIKFIMSYIKKQNENKKGSVENVFRKSSQGPNGQLNGQNKGNG